MTHQCIYIGTLLSRVAYPHIDIGLIESYPRGTSCRGDTCRSFIKDRQNKSRVKGLLVPYGTIELPQLAPSSTATIFSSTRIHGVPPTCSSSPTLNIKKESRVLRDFKFEKRINSLPPPRHFINSTFDYLKKYIYIYTYPILLPLLVENISRRRQSALEIPTREYLVENWSILRNHPV